MGSRTRAFSRGRGKKTAPERIATVKEKVLPQYPDSTLFKKFLAENDLQENRVSMFLAHKGSLIKIQGSNVRLLYDLPRQSSLVIAEDYYYSFSELFELLTKPYNYCPAMFIGLSRLESLTKSEN